MIFIYVFDIAMFTTAFNYLLNRLPKYQRSNMFSKNHQVFSLLYIYTILSQGNIKADNLCFI